MRGTVTSRAVRGRRMGLRRSVLVWMLILGLSGCGDGGPAAELPDTPVAEDADTDATATSDGDADGNGDGQSEAEQADTPSEAEHGDDAASSEGPGAVDSEDPTGPDIQLFAVPECSVVPNGSLSGADNLTILVAVRNGGPGAIDRLVRVLLESDTGLRAESNNAISSGSAFNPLQVDLSADDYSRTHRFTVTADPNNEIIERDESNNVLTVAVTLPARPSSSQDVPCTSP